MAGKGNEDVESNVGKKKMDFNIVNDKKKMQGDKKPTAANSSLVDQKKMAGLEEMESKHRNLLAKKNMDFNIVNDKKKMQGDKKPTAANSSLVDQKKMAGYGTSELMLDTDKDEGPGLVSREEEAAPEGQQPVVQAADTAVGAGRISAFREPNLVTWVDPVDGKVYIDIPVYVPPIAPVQTTPLSPLLSIGTPSSPEWSSSSFLVSPLSLVISTSVASPAISSPAASPDTVEAEDFMAELGAQWYRLRSLEREHERATVTFSTLWRPMLALEAWAGQTDAYRVALWHTMSDTQRENHDLRMQRVEDRHERLELADRVVRIERRLESREE
nr:hypothetical protein [Tanacetum cinerariifolium]